MTNIELAKALFEAFENSDEAAARAICSPDLEAIQNHGTPMSLDTLLQFSLAVTALVPDFHYEDAIRSETASGFVEEHRVLGTLPDGSAMALSACVVGEVVDGKITMLREYVDTAAAAGLIKALSGG